MQGQRCEQKGEWKRKTKTNKNRNAERNRLRKQMRTMQGATKTANEHQSIGESDRNEKARRKKEDAERGDGKHPCAGWLTLLQSAIFAWHACR
jgi:hypothetical protein